MEAMLVWGLALLAISVLLFVVDIFVPTAGVLAIVSLAVAIAGVVCLFRYNNTWGMIGVLAVIIGGPTLFFLGLNIMPNTPIGRKLVLGADSDEDARRITTADTYAQLVGAEGMVISDLRPVGVVKIGDERFDALSETTLIRSGTKIKVVAVVDGMTLKVRAVG